MVIRERKRLLAPPIILFIYLFLFISLLLSIDFVTYYYSYGFHISVVYLFINFLFFDGLRHAFRVRFLLYVGITNSKLVTSHAICIYIEDPLTYI